ncbi:uncharacterized protein LOC130902430 [Diorhabda carinulata]|uniref:uncharacterized protein LOC130902430 n=1 Tax=Diorhabda carinulata TaxID=1163345 RepID=UPI0025A12D43|nr:uncharacterized protein LOC130902430 [Diorhabda carinulata]
MFINILIFCFHFHQVKGFENYDIQESGRTQYQLLQERGRLPHYGSCWKSALEYLEIGCKYITEQIQSEIALHLTNCFLAMSGEDTYNCHSDKKYNLRAICISSMNDRAFNVYTEFYTHTQNMCGFLQGHVWQEMIAENTMVVGRQLEKSAQHQKDLLDAQKESFKLQEKMLHHGKVLENILENLFASFKEHHDILNLLSRTVADLRNWIIGEMSWFESILFYAASVVIILILTSSYRTNSARLVILFLLLINYLVERLICFIHVFLSHEGSSKIYSEVYNYIWISRYCFMYLSSFILLYFSIIYKDNSTKQYKILCSIQEQNTEILKILQTSQKTSKAIDRIDKLYLNRSNENIGDNSLLKSAKNISNKLQRVGTSSGSIKEKSINTLRSVNTKDKYNLDVLDQNLKFTYTK